MGEGQRDKHRKSEVGGGGRVTETGKEREEEGQRDRHRKRDGGGGGGGRETEI